MKSQKQRQFAAWSCNLLGVLSPFVANDEPKTHGRSYLLRSDRASLSDAGLVSPVPQKMKLHRSHISIYSHTSKNTTSRIAGHRKGRVLRSPEESSKGCGYRRWMYWRQWDSEGLWLRQESRKIAFKAFMLNQSTK